MKHWSIQQPACTCVMCRAQIGRRFINDLDSLMADLNATHAQFIRCIKPNLELKPQILVSFERMRSA
eukprot:2259858-Pleurochrysis_carterae.AAC.1